MSRPWATWNMWPAGLKKPEEKVGVGFIELGEGHGSSPFPAGTKGQWQVGLSFFASETRIVVVNRAWDKSLMLPFVALEKIKNSKNSKNGERRI